MGTKFTRVDVLARCQRVGLKGGTGNMETGNEEMWK